MNVGEPVIAMVYDFTLVCPSLISDEVFVDDLLRQDRVRTMGIDIPFPFTASNHLQVRIVECEVRVDILLAVDFSDIVGMLYSDTQFALSVGVQFNLTERNLIYML